MKRLFHFTLLVALSLLVFGGRSAYAVSMETEISFLSNDAVRTVNDLYGQSLDRPITTTDIDFSKAFKIFVDTNIFELHTNTKDDIITALADGDYIWELPIYIDGSTIILNICKGKPLDESITAFTEAEKAEIIKNVGKWLITAVYYYEGEIRDYYAIVKNELGNIPEDVIFIGGLPQFRSVVAIYFDEYAEIKGLIALGSSRPNIPSANNMGSGTGVAVAHGNGSRLYDYATTKEYINSLPKEISDDYTGGGIVKPDTLPVGNNAMQYWPFIAPAILGMTGGTYYFVKKKKSGTGKADL